MYKNRFRGFTLIELLVVIAIIGILSAVVLASLNTARSKGNDAAVQSNLTTILTEAEIYYGGTGGNTYGSQTFSSGAATACTTGVFSDTVIKNALAQADSANGAGNIDCFANATSYYVAAAMTNGYWCIDYTGNSKSYSSTLPTVATTFTGNACP